VRFVAQSIAARDGVGQPISLAEPPGLRDKR
jgi:hypothetical protein